MPTNAWIIGGVFLSPGTDRKWGISSSAVLCCTVTMSPHLGSPVVWEPSPRARKVYCRSSKDTMAGSYRAAQSKVLFLPSPHASAGYPSHLTALLLSTTTEYCCECCHCVLITTPSDLPSVKSDSISPLPLSFYSRGSAAEPSRNGLAPGWLIGCVGGRAGTSVRIPCKIKYYPPTKPRQFAGRRPTPISRWRDPGFLSAPQMDASTVQCSFARSMLLRLYVCFPGQTGGGALNPSVVCRRIMVMAHRQERGAGDCRGSHS